MLKATADLYIDPCYSPDDGGWYAEIIDSTGKTHATTAVVASRLKSIERAEALVQEIVSKRAVALAEGAAR